MLVCRCWQYAVNYPSGAMIFIHSEGVETENIYLLRQDIQSLAMDLAVLQIKLESVYVVEAFIKAGFRPDQRRVPRGQPGGGRMAVQGRYIATNRQRSRDIRMLKCRNHGLGQILLRHISMIIEKNLV